MDHYECTPLEMVCHCLNVICSVCNMLQQLHRLALPRTPPLCHLY